MLTVGSGVLERSSGGLPFITFEHRTREKKKRGQFNVDMLDKFIGTVPLKKAKEDTLFLSKWD